MKQPHLFDKGVVVERATSLRTTVKFKLEPFEGELTAYLVNARVGRVRENDKGLLEKRDATPVSEKPKA